MHNVPLWLWITLVVTVVAALAVDLLAHRREHVIGLREAAVWSGIWVGVAVAFGAVVFSWWAPPLAWSTRRTALLPGPGSVTTAELEGGETEDSTGGKLSFADSIRRCRSNCTSSGRARRRT